MGLESQGTTGGKYNLLASTSESLTFRERNDLLSIDSVDEYLIKIFLYL